MRAASRKWDHLISTDRLLAWSEGPSRSLNPYNYGNAFEKGQGTGALKRKGLETPQAERCDVACVPYELEGDAGIQSILTGFEYNEAVQTFTFCIEDGVFARMPGARSGLLPDLVDRLLRLRRGSRFLEGTSGKNSWSFNELRDIDNGDTAAGRPLEEVHVGSIASSGGAASTSSSVAPPRLTASCDRNSAFSCFSRAISSFNRFTKTLICILKHRVIHKFTLCTGYYPLFQRFFQSLVIKFIYWQIAIHFTNR